MNGNSIIAGRYLNKLDSQTFGQVDEDRAMVEPIAEIKDRRMTARLSADGELKSATSAATSDKTAGKVPPIGATGGENQMGGLAFAASEALKKNRRDERRNQKVARHREEKKLQLDAIEQVLDQSLREIYPAFENENFFKDCGLNVEWLDREHRTALSWCDRKKRQQAAGGLLGAEEDAEESVAGVHLPDIESENFYSGLAERSMNNLRKAMQYHIKDPKIVSIMQLGNFDFSVFREILAPNGLPVKEALEPAVCALHAPLWEISLDKTKFIKILTERAQLCTAQQASEVFMLQIQRMKQKRKLVCKEFLVKGGGTFPTTVNSGPPKKVVEVQVQESLQDVDGEKKKSAKTPPLKKDKRSQSRSKQNWEKATEKAIEKKKNERRCYNIGAGQLQSFLDNPRPHSPQRDRDGFLDDNLPNGCKVVPSDEPEPQEEPVPTMRGARAVAKTPTTLPSVGVTNPDGEHHEPPMVAASVADPGSAKKDEGAEATDGKTVAPLADLAPINRTSFADLVLNLCDKEIETISDLRRRILANYECIIDAIQIMQMQHMPMDNTSEGDKLRKTWVQLGKEDFHRVLSRTVSGLRPEESDSIFSQLDVRRVGAVNLRELLIALQVVSPSIYVEYLRAKLVARYRKKNNLTML